MFSSRARKCFLFWRSIFCVGKMQSVCVCFFFVSGNIYFPTTNVCLSRNNFCSRKNDSSLGNTVFLISKKNDLCLGKKNSVSRKNSFFLSLGKMLCLLSNFFFLRTRYLREKSSDVGGNGRANNVLQGVFCAQKGGRYVAGNESGPTANILLVNEGYRVSSVATTPVLFSPPLLS